MNNKVQNILLGVLAVGLIGITVAYATLSQQLKINGTAKVASAKWDVHFANMSTGAKTGYAEIATTGKLTASGTTVSGNFGTLKAPGDSITYTFDIENAGDINAIIDTVTGGQSFTCTSATKSVADAVCKDLTYSIKYTDGNATIAKDEASAICTQLKYTIKYSDGATTTIAKGDKLAKATSASAPTKKNVTLTITYNKTDAQQTLASEDVTVTADPMTITYVQDAK